MDCIFITDMRFPRVKYMNIDDFRLTLKLSCAMNFLIYPHDTQECKLQMESRKSSVKEFSVKEFITFMHILNYATRSYIS